jgi:hypothetical protein
MPPQDAFWYHLAYSIAAIVYAGYIVSLWWRRRKWQRRG